MELVKRGRGRPRKNSENTEQTFLITVQWQMAGQFLVKAKSLQDAVSAVEEDYNDLFPVENAQGEYVDDSFEINKDCCCIVQPHEIGSFNQPVVNVVPVVEQPVSNAVAESSNNENLMKDLNPTATNDDEGFDEESEGESDFYQVANLTFPPFQPT